MTEATKETQKINVSMKDLLEAGAHFGHLKNRWNPKMKRYIFEERNGIYIIDLSKTMHQLREACKVVGKTVAAHKNILFVGTKKQAKTLVREVAEESGEFYVAERWLGGMMTNLPTIKQSIRKLEKLEKQIATGCDGATKKELVELNKDYSRLNKNLAGIRTMRKLPGLIVIVDPSKEHIAVKEAKTLGIPVMAIVDTNCNPDAVDYVIAANDDALKSNKLILKELCSHILSKKKEMGVAVGKQVKVEDSKAAARQEISSQKQGAVNG